MVIYTNHHRLKRQFGGQHAIWWNGSGILSSEWIKTLVLKGPGINPINKNEHRTSNVQHRMLNEKNDDEASVSS